MTESKRLQLRRRRSTPQTQHVRVSSRTGRPLPRSCSTLAHNTLHSNGIPLYRVAVVRVTVVRVLTPFCAPHQAAIPPTRHFSTSWTALDVRMSGVRHV
eukprot:gene24950-biopygen23947